MTKKNYDVKDMSLAEAGRKRIEWAGRSMPVINLITERFKKRKNHWKAFGLRPVCILLPETANLALALKAGARTQSFAPRTRSAHRMMSPRPWSNTVSRTNAIKGEDGETYYKHIMTALDHKPQVTTDDGADLVSDDAYQTERIN